MKFTPVARYGINILLYLALVSSGWSIAHAQTSLTTLTQSSTNTATESTEAEGIQSPEAIRDMVARLSDQEVRALLLERLDAVAQAADEASTESAETGPIALLSLWGVAVYESVLDAVARTPQIYGAQKYSVESFIAQRGSTHSLRILGIFLLAIVLGLLVEWVVRMVTRQWVTRLDKPIETDSFKDSFIALSLRLCLELAGIVVFMIVALVAISKMPTFVDKQFFRFLLFAIIIGPRFMMAVSRFLMAPNRPELRLVHTDDWTAKFIYKHSWGLFLLMGIGRVIVEFNRFNGISPEVARIGFWFALAIPLYIIYITWNAREGMTKMLIGTHGNVTPLEKKIATIYPYFVIATCVLVWLVLELIIHLEAFHLFRKEPHIVTFLILLFIPVLDTLIRAVVSHAVAPMDGDGVVATKAYNSTHRSYLRIGRILVFGLIILLLMDVWQIELHTVASSAVGATVAAHVIQLLIIFSIGYFIWEIISLLINRKLAAEHSAIEGGSENQMGGEGGGAGSSRISTILPLVRFTLQTVVIAMTLLIGLSNIGINATPLLAGAGVVGIAVGFGAQKLVQDVVSGVFFLIDDAFRAGEYLDIGGTVGTVEKISLRSMQLRHHRGAVHTIPYGEIPQLTNYSRDWVTTKMKFTVPFDTDLAKVKRLFKQIGKDVVDLPQFKDDLLQPFKFQGAMSVNDVGILIGCKFTAKPGTQFMMRKELYQRIKSAFDENGIQFARKEVRVRLDGEHHEELSESQMKEIAGAASAADDDIPDGKATT